MIKISMPTKQVTTTKKLQIKSCNELMLWYNLFIGETFDIIKESPTEFWVRDKNGYSNYVLKTDCIIYKDDAEILETTKEV